MDNYTLVRPEHLNHYGVLFGGALLKWVDEYAWLAASRDFPGCRLVTVGMNRIEFREQVANGTILRFHIRFHSQGKTSVTYSVNVTAEPAQQNEAITVFSTQVTLVRIDELGKKCHLPRHVTHPECAS
ncbi:acyl-CoA thioesterase [bacterium]|nr:acyl-CoA thioesterase [bacterium]